MPEWRTFRGEYPDVRPPALLLSAGVPTMPTTELASEAAGLTREAVIYLARFAFVRGFQILVRADPIIVLTLLAEAEHFAAAGPSVVAFDDGRASATQLDMGRWAHGVLVRTSQSDALRDALVAAPVGATVFAGGGSESDEDYRAWQARFRQEPIYPIGSTGGAADRVLGQLATVGQGRRPGLRRTLAEVSSYPLVMAAMFEDLGVP